MALQTLYHATKDDFVARAMNPLTYEVTNPITQDVIEHDTHSRNVQEFAREITTEQEQQARLVHFLKLTQDFVSEPLQEINTQ